MFGIVRWQFINVPALTPQYFQSTRKVRYRINLHLLLYLLLAFSNQRYTSIK